MIEFKGETSKGCKKFIQKKFITGLRFASLLWVILVSSIITVIALSFNKMVFLFLIVQIPWLIFVSCPIPSMQPYRVEIGEDYLAVECETIDGKKSSIVQNMIDVKDVIDMGEWYYISFYFPHKTIFFTCEKKLLVEGTIEEFEALFEDKLIRQTDN